MLHSLMGFPVRNIDEGGVAQINETNIAVMRDDIQSLTFMKHQVDAKTFWSVVVK